MTRGMCVHVPPTRVRRDAVYSLYKTILTKAAAGGGEKAVEVITSVVSYSGEKEEVVMRLLSEFLRRHKPARICMCSVP